MKTYAVSTINVLIVEDEPAIYNVCLRVLSDFGFDVDIAVNGKIGKEMIIRKEYDLCLVDVRTPEMNGRELYNWCLENIPYLTNRIIFTTGDITGDDTKNFLDQSGRLFLPKPFTIEELRASVRKFLEVEGNEFDK